jgi:hypothetical protein
MNSLRALSVVLSVLLIALVPIMGVVFLVGAAAVIRATEAVLE